MLTLKFMSPTVSGGEDQEVYETCLYKQSVFVDETNHSTKLFQFDCAGREQTVQISELDEDWDVCYVVNAQGTTIDKIVS